MVTRKLGFSALLAAFYLRLTPHDLTKSYSFYNYVKGKVKMPYHVVKVRIGRESDDYTTRDTEAEELAPQVDSWVDETSGKGDKPCADMQNNIIQAITSSPLVVGGYHTPAHVSLDYANILDDDTEPERAVKHGVLRFRVEMAPSS